MSSTISARIEMKLGDLANVRLLGERRAELRRLRRMRDRYIANAQADVVLQTDEFWRLGMLQEIGLRNSMSVNCLAFATESSIADYKTFDIEKYQRRRSNFRCAAIRWPVGRGSQRRNRVRKVSQPFMSGCDPH